MMFPSRMFRPRTIWSSVLALLLVLPLAGVAFGQDAAKDQAKPPDSPSQSPLALASVDVTPEEPTPQTLCKLSVTLQNTADRPISALRFVVTVNGHSLPVYDKQVFLDVVPPGGEVTVPLYNFWVTETHRPLPEKGPLTVEVQVTDARWTKMTVEPLETQPAESEKPAKPGESTETGSAEAQEVVETWTLLDSLEALPAAVTATRTLRR